MDARIGRYEILGELGRGGMGVVYRAQDPVIGRTVAIKTIRLQGFSEADELERLRERLFREARSAGILSHPNIVTIYDIGQEGDTAYIAMEFVAGTTLDAMLRRTPPAAPEQLLRILRETASALDYAHSKGIIHRDIKPANIMVTEGGSVKVTDFGVAKIASHQITHTEMLLGTPSYMAPEQIEGKPLDGRADQFALGVIAYEVLTGDKPFVSESLASLLFKIVHEEPVGVHRLNPSLGEAVSEVVRKAMSKQVDNRYPTCQDFVRNLEVALDACQGWRAQPRGAALAMETVIASQVRGGVVDAGDSDTTAGTPRPQPAAVVLEASRATPPVEPPSLLAAQEANTKSRKGLLAAMLAVVGVAGGVAVWTFLPSAETPAVPEPVPEAKVERKAEDRPSPVGPPPPVAASSSQMSPSSGVRPAASPPGNPASAIVEMTSTPPGARVRIDQTAEGCTTPCSMELSGGRHLLQFTLEGYRPAVMAITVPDEQSAMVKLDRVAGTLAIRTTPPDAEIYINGRLHERRSPAIITLPVGRYRLELRQPGMKPLEQDIDVRDGVTQTVEVSWQTNP